jgi:hypothetical protein
MPRFHLLLPNGKNGAILTRVRPICLAPFGSHFTTNRGKYHNGYHREVLRLHHELLPHQQYQRWVSVSSMLDNRGIARSTCTGKCAVPFYVFVCIILLNGCSYYFQRLTSKQMQYWEPAKFSAELRHRISDQSGPILLKMDMDSGA